MSEHVTAASSIKLSDVKHEKKYEAAVSNGQSALRALLTMNGGAIVVFLTFLGNLWGKVAVPEPSIRIFVDALLWFIIGIGFALVAYCAIFVSNCFSVTNRHKLSDTAIGVTLVGGFMSLVCFPIGSYKAITAFQSTAALFPR
jgi:hypothetical protein